ncbi:hypothetical protein TorRG33x02_276660 [Trema orientale]|uniref:Uncharacterized protein n=1 Tax=Trema orientale TaxID=63057 RepID=A0A2P5CQE3_TREOI|nr:hypothetical protein TorRG33x02_276660 [Trema orientale]
MRRDLSHDWSSGQWPRLVSINTHCHYAYDYDYHYGPLTNPRRKKGVPLTWTTLPSIPIPNPTHTRLTLIPHATCSLDLPRQSPFCTEDFKFTKIPSAKRI